MSPSQSLEIVNTVGILWPNLKLSDEARHAWRRVLARLDYVDAVQAVTELATERTTIQIAHIGQRVERIKAERLARVPELDLFGDVPDDIVDDGALYSQWLRTRRDRLSRVS